MNAAPLFGGSQVQVRMLIGRQAGEIVEMPYDRAVANRALGHVEIVHDAVNTEPAAIAVGKIVAPIVAKVRPAPRPRGRLQLPK